jgi:hypothetical protein
MLLRVKRGVIDVVRPERVIKGEDPTLAGFLPIHGRGRLDLCGVAIHVNHKLCPHPSFLHGDRRNEGYIGKTGKRPLIEVVTSIATDHNQMSTLGAGRPGRPTRGDLRRYSLPPQTEERAREEQQQQWRGGGIAPVG